MTIAFGEAMYGSSQSLAGKVALVTGGGRGIGAAIARRLALAQAQLIITYHRSAGPAIGLAEDLRSLGADVLEVPLDIGSIGSIEDAIATLGDRLGRIDILVNNAGLALEGRIEAITPDQLAAMVAVNVTGVFRTTQQVLRWMPSGGRIVNIGSIGNEHMPITGHSVYAMTKGAVAGLTHGLTRELAERSITINTVQPGRIDTDMLRSVLGDRFEAAREQTPLGRFGTADEVAELVHFLCTPAASYITGASLRVDGGVAA